MAGKRPTDNQEVTSNVPLVSDDYLMVINPSEDRKIKFSYLQEVIRDGTGLEASEDKDNLTFTTKAELKAITTPSNGNYRFKDNSLQLYNVNTGKWHSIWIAQGGAGGAPILQWSAEGVD